MGSIKNWYGGLPGVVIVGIWMGQHAWLRPVPTTVIRIAVSSLPVLDLYLIASKKPWAGLAPRPSNPGFLRAR